MPEISPSFIWHLILKRLFSGNNVINLIDPEGRVNALIKTWFDNIASIDRRLRLLAKMQVSVIRVMEFYFPMSVLEEFF